MVPLWWKGVGLFFKQGTYYKRSVYYNQKDICKIF